MPSILGANSVRDNYQIENSLRSEADDSPKLSKTVSTATNTTNLTVSLWYKLGELADMGFISKFADSNNRFHLRIMSDGSLLAYNNVSGTNHYKTTTAKLRDFSAWYHIVFAYDTTDSTAADRLKIYLNGTRLTSFVNNTNPSENEALKIASDTSNPIKLFCSNDEDAYLSGYVSDLYYIDGQTKAPTDFGRTDKNGVWIPKKYTGSFGNNGFKMEFKQTGTSANSSGMGADTSGNDHHLAVANLAGTDITVDTPTNNFCTLNPLTKRPTANGTIAEGNLQYTASTSDSSIYGTIGIPPGMKVYFEVKLVSNTAQNAIGIHNLYDGGDGAFVKGGSEAGTWSFKPRGAASVAQYFNNGSATNTGVNNYADGTIVGVAVDNANGHIHYHINGTYINSSDPTDNNPVALVTGHDETIEQYLHFSLDTTTTQPKNQYNFGNPVHSISSANADANGYGSFEYAVPSGYYALCTKNLAEFG